MKEFNYTKWDNKPREMWVWDNNENEKHKRFIVYIDFDYLKKGKPSVLSSAGYWYHHCAEIEPTRRMTNYELAHWLWEGTQVGEFREYTMGTTCHTRNDYEIVYTNETVPDDAKIRINGGEWKEPLIEE